MEPGGGEDILIIKQVTGTMQNALSILIHLLLTK